MPLPASPLALHGGCNCQAIRYRISIPEFSARPWNPYRVLDTDIGDLRMPMVAVDHCNDCRRATGAILPMWIATPIAFVSASCLSRSAKSRESRDEIWLPATKVFDSNSREAEDSWLTFYKSSQGRTRSFCGRCGTPLCYRVDEGVIPEEWGWPQMLDIVLGTVDRDDLDADWMVPEREMWWDMGIDWVKSFARRGGNEIPRHPLSKINHTVEE